MDTKNFLLLSGGTAIFLATPAVAVPTSDRLIPIKDFIVVKEKQRSPAGAWLVHQKVTPQKSVITAPEQSVPDFSSLAVPLGKPVQSVTSIADKDKTTVTTSVGSLPPARPSEPARELLSGGGGVLSENLDLRYTLSPEPPCPWAPAVCTSDRNLVSQAKPHEEAAGNQEESSLAPPPEKLNQESATDAQENSPNSSMTQMNSVSQLSDVQPTDWSFQALLSLEKRYGAIAGYADGTFRGDRALTRYEFAASLKAAMDKITGLISSGFADKVSKQDLETLRKLQEEFAVELATLQSRVGRIEARTAKLERQQFSPTAFLGGEAIFALATASGGNPPGKGLNNAVLTHLTQLQVASSFTGKDLLRVGLATGNFANGGFTNPESLNTNMALLSYQADLQNQIQLNSLEYRFAAFGDRVVFTVKPVGFSLSSVLTPNSPYDDPGQGAISRFAGATPIFKIGNLDAGLGFDWLLSNKVRLQFAYGARNASNSSQGLLASDHRALGVQLLVKPTSTLIAGVAYVNAFSRDGRLDTFTGSNNADVSGGFNEPAAINALGGTLQWRLAPNLTFGTWGGVTLTNSLKSNALALSTTYLFSLGLSDPFGRKGDLLAFLVGQPPKLNAGLLIERADEGTSIHYEAFYRLRLSDYVSITPGFFLVTNPGQISENKSIFVGTIRTTFSF